MTKTTELQGKIAELQTYLSDRFGAEFKLRITAYDLKESQVSTVTEQFESELNVSFGGSANGNTAWTEAHADNDCNVVLFYEKK